MGGEERVGHGVRHEPCRRELIPRTLAVDHDLPVAIRSLKRGHAFEEASGRVTQERLRVIEPRIAEPTQFVHRFEQAEQDETRKAAKRLVIENNKAWRSAETVRREWLATFAQRKSAPKDAATFIATALVRHISPDRDALALARTWLNLPAYQWGQPDPLAEVIAKATPARAQHIALVLILATIEQTTIPSAVAGPTSRASHSSQPTLAPAASAIGCPGTTASRCSSQAPTA